MDVRKEDLRILIACEESQAICTEFRKRGFIAFSNDIQECSGGHPEWHVIGDCIPLIQGNCLFQTMDGKIHVIVGAWDLLIAHPPCTYLTCTGNAWFNIEKYGAKAEKRYKDREEAAKFFMQFVSANAKSIAIENPIGYMSNYYKKPTQIIQPYFFGDAERKSTCLWLENLPKLKPTNIVEPQIIMDIGGGIRTCHYGKYRHSTFRTAKEQKRGARLFLALQKQ